MGTVADAIAQVWREDDGRRPATEVYETVPCVQCRRPRVMLLRNGQRQCEKCETIQP